LYQRQPRQRTSVWRRDRVDQRRPIYFNHRKRILHLQYQRIFYDLNQRRHLFRKAVSIYQLICFYSFITKQVQFDEESHHKKIFSKQLQELQWPQQRAASESDRSDLKDGAGLSDKIFVHQKDPRATRRYQSTASVLSALWRAQRRQYFSEAVFQLQRYTTLHWKNRLRVYQDPEL